MSITRARHARGKELNLPGGRVSGRG
jgi:hypothetical protein